MPYPIVIWPNEVLDNPTEPVTDFGPELQALLERMHQAVIEAQGQGIAANQIGVPKSVALVRDDQEAFLEIVNPKILSREEPVVLEEGCLSVPGEWHKVPRHRKVRVRYQDKTGAVHEVEAQDRLAHVFQHEIDHLEGVVYVRHLSALKRDLIRRKMRRLAKEAREAGEEAT